MKKSTPLGRFIARERRARKLTVIQRPDPDMKPCWRDRGLTEIGVRRVEPILEAMIALVANAGSDAVRIALDEASFRVEVLPTRSESYQRRYLKANK